MALENRPGTEDSAELAREERVSKDHAYELIRSKRKTVAMEITGDLKIIVRAPVRMRRADIDSFVMKYSRWIDETMEIKRRKNQLYPPPDEQQLPQFKKAALEYLSQRVEHFSQIMGLYPTGIKITSGKKRLGSCNRNGGICFSWRVMLNPPEAIDYIVVHELAHLKHMDHSKNFYSLVQQYMPDWKQRRDMLR